MNGLCKEINELKAKNETLDAELKTLNIRLQTEKEDIETSWQKKYQGLKRYFLNQASRFGA
jgi:FtsZ-binding cell division protein ZapB